MPTFRDPVPKGFLPFRLHAVTIHATWTKFFVVPEFEIGVLRAGWRGNRIDVQPTSDVAHIPDNPETVFQNLIAKYGERTVRQFHAGPERLGEDMRRQADETYAFIRQAIANEEEQERRRVAAEREGRRQSLAMQQQQQDAERADIKKVSGK